MMRTPLDMDDILSEIKVPDMGCALVGFNNAIKKEKEDLFAEHKRKGWDKSIEARCDFTRKIRITRRSNIFFLSLWQKSVFGRTLTDIKSDASMVGFFVAQICPVIKDIFGEYLHQGNWCIITTPKRRHLTKNFATMISEGIAAELHLPFYEDVCSCHTKQRINAVFTVNVIPKEQNIICFDDFVTTGQTLAAMKRALEPYHKNMVFVTGINNKL